MNLIQRLTHALAAALCVGALAAAESTSSVKEPTVDQVIEGYVKALGGRPALEKLQSAVGTGTLEMAAMGVNAPFEMKLKAPNQRATKVDAAGFGVIREGCDGKVAWSQMPGSSVTMKSGSELHRALRDAVFNRELRFRELYEKVEFKGKSTVAGADALVILATPKAGEGYPETFFFDAKTGLLVQSHVSVDTPNGKTDMELRMEDYRLVGSVKVAHVLRLTKPEEIAFTLRIKEFKHNQPIADSEFAKPAE
jgi:zinc protease